MSKKQTSIRLSDEHLRWLSRYAREGEEAVIIEQLREDLTILEGLIRAGRSEIAGVLTEGEACLICDVLNGNIFYPEMSSSAHAILAHEVHDGMVLNDLADKWKIDMPELERKLLSLSPLGAFVIFHLARLFWRDSERDGREMVRELFPLAK